MPKILVEGWNEIGAAIPPSLGGKRFDAAVKRKIADS